MRDQQDLLAQEGVVCDHREQLLELESAVLHWGALHVRRVGRLNVAQLGEQSRPVLSGGGRIEERQALDGIPAGDLDAGDDRQAGAWQSLGRQQDVGQHRDVVVVRDSDDREALALRGVDELVGPPVARSLVGRHRRFGRRPAAIARRVALQIAFAPDGAWMSSDVMHVH